MYTVTTFYKFIPIAKDSLKQVQTDLQSKGKRLNILGLVLLAEEGTNATIAGSAKSIDAFKKVLEVHFGEMTFKDSQCTDMPFKRYMVKIRKEIVAIGDPAMQPTNEDFHLTPTEWNDVMENEDVVVLDTRNDYETLIGKFKGAIDPNLHTFDTFPKYVSKCDIPKTKKVLMYCTGGIRCEKALLEMRKQGYKNVYQLQGGILQYLKEYPHKYFEGECFVFDHRASLSQELDASSRYSLCPHCGDPGDVHIACEQCSFDAIICERCQLKESKRTCSKNCAYLHSRSIQKC